VEEAELQRIAKEHRIQQSDLVALRVTYKRHLPGLAGE
jgi:hypothetical protein